MAQSVFANQRPHYVKSDDPLADLAAITGYRGEDTARSVDDFAIDLERELMGAFGGEEEAENLVDQALDADLEAGFDELFQEGAIEAEDDFGLAEPLAADPANSNEIAATPPVWSGAEHFDDYDEGLEEPAPVEAFAGNAAPELPPEDPGIEASLSDAFVDMDFGDFDAADFAPATEAAPAYDEQPARAVVADENDFEAQLLSEIDTGPRDNWQEEEPVAQELAVEDFESELSAALETPAPAMEAPARAETVVAAPADPFAELATLAASFKTARPSAFSRAPSWAVRREEAPVAETAAVPTFQPDYAEPTIVAAPAAAPAYEADIAAPEMFEEAIPATGEFDLPEEIYAEDPAPEAFSDIDVEFPEPARISAQDPDVPGDEMDRAEAELTDFFSAELARQSALIAAEPEHAARPTGNYAPVERNDVRAEGRVDVEPAPKLLIRQPNRGLWVAAGVAAVALLAGAGALAFMGGKSTPSQPALVKADTAPIKVKPENPGGTEIANQDKAVYDKVAGAEAAAKPQQPKLVSTAEEPVDVNAAAAERAPAVKAEDRVAPDQAPAKETSAIAAVQPRKVRTLIVRPDGTLVAPEEVAKAAAPIAGAAPTVTYQPPAAAQAEQPPEAAPAAVDATSVATATPDEDPVKQVIADEAPAKPAEKPVVAKKPVEKAKPATAKAKPAAEKVASAEPAPAASAGGDWSIQIASQPSKDGATASYQALSGKFGSIIGGRGVSIVQAEIPGKGTFYRVRIPAGSKSDANALCARYQAAGGSCFITR